MSLEDSSGSSVRPDEAWISWFCSTIGNHVLCEVDKPFIEDSFNLFGIKQFIPNDFSRAMSVILDKEDQDDEDSDELHQAASLLYGLIHARFIITNNGLQAMQRKYMQKEFGECPRTYCNGQAALPIGLADEPNLGSYKLFCPKCRDIFNCHPAQPQIDGAFFGTSFPHIFLMTYETCVPSAPTNSFVPRVFGFKIHPTSTCMPKKVVVLDGTSYSNDDGSSDDLNFASSVESGAHLALVGAAGAHHAGSVSNDGNGHGNGNGVPVVYDLTNEPVNNSGEAGTGYGNSSSAVTTLETLGTAAQMCAERQVSSEGAMGATEDVHFVHNTGSDGSHNQSPAASSHAPVSGSAQGGRHQQGQKRSEDFQNEAEEANGKAKRQKQ